MPTASFARLVKCGPRAAVLILAAACGFAAHAIAAAPPEISFHPASASPDYLDLFTHPESWAEARSHVGVFIFGPANLLPDRGPNSLDRIAAVDGFRKVRQWGLKTQIGVGVVKRWDCTGSRKTPELAIRNIADVNRNGGTVDDVAMDEPLASGILSFGQGKRDCHLTIEQTADATAGFVRQVAAAVAQQHLGPAPQFIETESYPSLTVEQQETYVGALLAKGFRPAAYDLDIAMGQVDRLPGGRQKLASDLRTLKAFLAERQIPLGIILWSSNGNEISDQSYFEDTLAFTRMIHGMVGQVPHLVFSSWVLRCGKGRAKCQPDATCPGVAAALCGEKSVPVNLPENDPNTFSHTRLILAALGIMAGP